MPRYPKKTKLEEKMELGYRYQTVMRYAWSVGPLCEAIEDEAVSVYMSRGRNRGFTVLLEGDPMSACSTEHAEMIVANPAKQFPPRSFIDDAPGEIALRIQFDYSPVVRAMREMERGALHFDWINPRDVERLLEEAWGSLAEVLAEPPAARDHHPHRPPGVHPQRHRHPRGVRVKRKNPPSEKPTKARPFVFVGRWRSENMPRWVCRCKTLEDAKGEAQTFFRNHTTGSIKGGLLHELDGTTHVFYADGSYFCTIPPLSSIGT